MAVVTASTKEAIRHTACRLFRERGFHATSVRDIAEAVGIQGGSIYSHYEGKDELLWDIVNESAGRFFAAIRPVIDSPLGVLQKLTKAVIAHVEVIAGDLDAAAVYTVEWRHLSPERRAAVTCMRDEYERLFRELVSQGIRERYLDARPHSSFCRRSTRCTAGTSPTAA
jgi:AcrR family transcriptional regulator